jgi:hypothetical protein
VLLLRGDGGLRRRARGRIRETVPRGVNPSPLRQDWRRAIPSQIPVTSMVEPESAGSKEKLWAALDAEGESKVRERLVLGFYGDVGEQRALVLEWLRSKVQNEASEIRAAAAPERAAAASERRARAAKRRANAERRAEMALILLTIAAAGVAVLIIIGLAK